jgi:phage-related minor tail protein
MKQTDFAEEAIFDFIDGTKSAKDAFLDFARSFLTEIAKMIMQQMILNALKSVAGSYFGFADGGIISGGTGQMMPIQAFASGGVVKRPTMAIMGEGKYNEAVVPLPDGRSIPVSMKGGGNQFNINVNVDGSKGGTPEQNDKLGKQIAREVKEQVKKIIADERRYGGTLGAQAARAY